MEALIEVMSVWLKSADTASAILIMNFSAFIMDNWHHCFPKPSLPPPLHSLAVQSFHPRPVGSRHAVFLISLWEEDPFILVGQIHRGSNWWDCSSQGDIPSTGRDIELPTSILP